MRLRKIDHSGETHYEWTILQIDHSYSKRDTYYICRCKCGKIKSHTYSTVASGRSKSCRSCSARKVGEASRMDLTGVSFGQWTVLEASASHNKILYWICKCVCGCIKSVAGEDLRSGKSTKCKSCHGRIVGLRHGHAARGKIAPEYNSWAQLKNRCLNQNNKRYADYGGRGIIVCEEWKESFELFLQHVGEKPFPDYSIDRINNDGNYEPGNVKWSSPKEQASNRRPKRISLRDKIEELKRTQINPPPAPPPEF